PGRPRRDRRAGQAARVAGRKAVARQARDRREERKTPCFVRSRALRLPCAPGGTSWPLPAPCHAGTLTRPSPQTFQPLLLVPLWPLLSLCVLLGPAGLEPATKGL